MAETDPQGAPPAGGGKPPAPPGTGGPGRAVPDPFDHGPPIAVTVDGRPIGDLGNRAVDQRLLNAVLHGWSEVAEWLVAFGVTAESQLGTELIHRLVSLDRLALGRIGNRHTDAPLVWAIAARNGPLGQLTHEHISAAFPDAAWL